MEDLHDTILKAQSEMKSDPLYQFLIMVRNDTKLKFNVRCCDDGGSMSEKLERYLNECKKGCGRELLDFLQQEGFFRDFSPAKRYFLSDLGKSVERKIRTTKVKNQKLSRTKEEQEQAREFSRLIEQLDI